MEMGRRGGERGTPCREKGVYSKIEPTSHALFLSLSFSLFFQHAPSSSTRVIRPSASPRLHHQRLPHLLALLLAWALRLPMASAQYCDPGATTTCDRVLVVCSDTPDFCGDVRSSLQSTAAFSTVDTFDARTVGDGGSGATPSAAHLGGYHAVLTYTNGPFADSTLMGDRLAAYHDQGGGVVVAVRANTDLYLQGRYGTVSSGYALMNYAQGSTISPRDNLGEVLEPHSPLMYQVASLSTYTGGRSTAPVVAGRGVVVARWYGGGQEPLVLRGKRGDRNLVELNFPPVSKAAYPFSWSGDGANLLRNGLKYSRCMPSLQCGAGTYAVAGGE
jgi:hypothetical protein